MSSQLAPAFQAHIIRDPERARQLQALGAAAKRANRKVKPFHGGIPAQALGMPEIVERTLASVVHFQAKAAAATTPQSAAYWLECAHRAAQTHCLLAGRPVRSKRSSPVDPRMRRDTAAVPLDTTGSGLAAVDNQVDWNA